MKQLKYVIVLLSTLTFMSLSSPGPAFGQSVGDRVRVTLADDELIGSVVQVEDEGFVLYRPGRERHTIEFNDISILERRTKSGSHWKFGGAVGFAVGGTAGGFLGWGAKRIDNNLSDTFSREDETGWTVAGVFLGGVTVGLLGSGIGFLIKKHKWQAIPIPSVSGRLRISPMLDVASSASNRRAVLGARIRF
ncbi:MAG: hypothetical protein OYM47_12720 [Gemmatimonadota bacterium]|nr:hypothetical protein [Gemmatimonadota bacterium]